MPEMSAEQESKLALFKEITSYDEGDHDKVIKLLGANNWNLEIAVPRFFDGNFDEDPVVPPRMTESTGIEQFENPSGLHARRAPSMSEPQRLNSPLFDFQEGIPRFPKAIMISDNWKFKLGLPPRQQPHQGTVSPIIFIFLLIPRTIALILSGLANLIDFLFPGFSRMLGLIAEPNSFPSEPLYNEVQPEFQAFYDELTEYDKESEESNTKRVVFHEGEYNNAYNFAKSNLKWLVVILVNNASKNSLKTLSSNDLFKKFNDRNDIILWGGNVDYIEPFEVGKTYRVRKLPQLILIANVSKAGEFPLMSVVNKITLPLNISNDGTKTIFKKLQRSIDAYEPQLISQRYDKQEQEFSRQIRREQDDAYNRSLLADKLKMEAKLEQKRKEEEAAKREKAKEEERIYKAKLKESYLILKSIDLLESNDNFERGNHTTIQFRMNTGERIVQKFLASKSLYDVFLFIDCKLYLKNFDDFQDDVELLNYLKTAKLDTVVDTTEYEHVFKFELIQPIPRFVLEPKADTPVSDVKEIWPNGNLLVEFDVDDEEYEEDEEEDEEEGET